MAAIDELSPYRDPRKGLRIPIGDATEIAPETIEVDDRGRARPRVTNPNVGAGGSAEAREFRASRNATPGGAVRPTPGIGQITRASLMRRAAGLAAGPVGAALTVAEVVPAMATAGRERGAGRDIADPNAGSIEAGDLRPGQLGAVRAGALEKARGRRLQAAYADPSIAGQSVGAYGGAVQAQANDIAALSTPRVPTAAGAGRGFVNPAPVRPQPGGTLEQDVGIGAGPGRGFVNPPAVQPEPEPRGGFVAQTLQPGERSPIDIERTALAIEQQNSALRRQQVGPGVSGGGIAELGGGYGARIQRLNNETDVAGRRFDARLAAAGGGRRDATRAAGISASADALERLQVGERESVRREGGDADRTALAAETARRGQDIGALVEPQRAASAIAVERERGKSARDIASLGADSRVAAAEARTQPRFTVVPGGQEVRDVNGFPQVVTLPSRVLDASGKPLDIGPAGAAAGAQPTPRAEYDKMPKGARYIGPDGKPYIKG